MEHGNLYKDGLIRSLIHFLELDGAEFLLVRGNDLLYRDIGFARMPPETNGTERFGEMIREEIRRGDVLWINLQQFFQKQA